MIQKPSLLKHIRRHGILLTILLSLLFLGTIVLSGLSSLNIAETTLMPTARQITVDENRYNEVMQNEESREIHLPVPVSNPFAANES
ncbi:MAG: hypothetical protein WCV86_03165 [Patescibacteria group bacterium]|jgi:hypothetical protein